MTSSRRWRIDFQTGPERGFKRRLALIDRDTVFRTDINPIEAAPTAPQE